MWKIFNKTIAQGTGLWFIGFEQLRLEGMIIILVSYWHQPSVIQDASVEC